MKKIITSATIALTLSACSWVQITPGGQAVRLVQNKSDVANCKELGSSTSKVMAKFFVERSRDKVAQELADLARNSAAEMGGDTIVPISDIDDGKRTFGIYQCVAPR